MAYDKKGYTRYSNKRIKRIIGDHVAMETGVTFEYDLNFTAASVQFFETKMQDTNIQFTKADVNSIEESGNVICAKIQASGTHTITFSSDFVQSRNDFVGSAGTFYIWFTYLPDGKILYTIIQDD